VAGIFSRSGPESLEKIRGAHLRKDWNGLAKATHHFKSTCSGIGAQRMAEICKSIERAAAEPDLRGEIEGLLGRAEQEFLVARQSLGRILAAGKGNG